MTTTLLSCPRCRRETDRLKTARGFEWLLFLGVGASLRMESVVGCPPCVRRRLFGRLLVNLLPAHVMWPLTVLPVHLVQIAATWLPGHARRVREALSRPASSASAT